MNKYSVLVADSCETSRMMICELLIKRGYRTFQATDGGESIRMARSIRPSLVIMDIDLWGVNAYESAYAIERDGLSTVIFVTDKVSDAFYQKQKYMNVFAYVMKPINPEVMHQTIEFSIINSNKINILANKVKQLESTLESRKKLDRAKGILIDKLRISENDAYGLIRKKSMDKCVSIERMAEIIIEEYMTNERL